MCYVPQRGPYDRTATEQQQGFSFRSDMHTSKTVIELWCMFKVYVQPKYTLCNSNHSQFMIARLRSEDWRHDNGTKLVKCDISGINRTKAMQYKF